MARKTIILGQKQMSFSKAIQQITGWSKKEFETQKRLMRYRVQKFNYLTGSNLSAIEQLFYKVHYEAKRDYYVSKGYKPRPLNDLQQALQNMGASPTRTKSPLKIINGKVIKTYEGMTKAEKRAYEVAQQFIEKRFDKFAQKYGKAGEIMDLLKNGLITPDEANRELSAYAEKVRNLKNEDISSWLDEVDDDTIGSP